MKEVTQRRKMVERRHTQLSIVQQCILLGIHRSGLDYKPAHESKLNEELMRQMDAVWCVDVVREAIERYGKPIIFNTDQGAQFTSSVFSQFILDQGIKLSMDGKGRATDNAFIERFWRSLKYEHVYLYPCQDAVELYSGINEYIQYYNESRRHTSLNDQRPKEVYEQTLSQVA